MAAEAEGDPVAWSEVLDFVKEAKEAGRILVVEGAGGLLVPITSEKSFADLALALSLPVVVVVGSRLGAINQALLTFEVLRAKNIPTLGYVYNEVFAPKALEPKSGTSTIVTADETNRDLLLRVAKPYEINELASIPHSTRI